MEYKSRVNFWILIFLGIFLCSNLAIAQASSSSEKKTSQSSPKDENSSKSEEESSEKTDNFSFGIGVSSSNEEMGETENIEVSGESVKKININGVTLKGNFRKISSGVYIAEGKITPQWSFSFEIEAAGRLKIDTNEKTIEGEAYVNLPVFGKILQVTDFDFSPQKIKFKGVFSEGINFPATNLRLDLCKGIADFEISSKRIAVQAYGGALFSFSGIPKIGTLEIELLSGSAGFSTDIPPKGITISGSGKLTIPCKPPIKINLSGSLLIKRKEISGEGSASVFKIINIGNGNFTLNNEGILSAQGSVGIEIGNILDLDVAGGNLEIDFPSQTANCKLTQGLELLNGFIDIPGSSNAFLFLDNKTKIIKITSNVGFPLVPQTVIAPQALSFGLKNGALEITNYNTNPEVKINGDLYISSWTLGGFSGEIANYVLSGKGSLGLPPGLSDFIGLEKIEFPLSLDLRSLKTTTDIGMDLTNVFVKHFPLEGSKLIIKKDGIHLKGQIGIKNVITIPLGDLVFTKDEEYTSFSGDISLGPFTVAQAKFNLPNDSDSISFEGKIGILGEDINIKGEITSEGDVEVFSFADIGFLEIQSLSEFSVSSEGLHAQNVKLGLEVGGVSKCNLSFNDLDITPSKIEGEAQVSFSSVVGISKSFGGNFSFDGHEAEIVFPQVIELCGIKVKDVVFNISSSVFSGSGKIEAANGDTINVSMSINNGMLTLKNPAGEIIATGFNISKKFANIIENTAEKEKKVLSEDANKALDNLSRMSKPWVEDFVKVAKEAKEFYSSLGRLVKEKIINSLKDELNSLQEKINSAIKCVKEEIDEAVDTFCDGIKQLVSDIEGIFSQIESLIPSNYRSKFGQLRRDVKSTANTLKTQVDVFRSSIKETLYATAGAISNVYQIVLDKIGEEANVLADTIKSKIDPIITGIDHGIVEVEKEIELASTATKEEAKKHLERAETIAKSIKDKAEGVINNYEKKLTSICSPYVRKMEKVLLPYFDRVEQLKKEVGNQVISQLKEAKSMLDPYINSFEDKFNSFYNFVKNIGGDVLNKLNSLLKSAGNTFNNTVAALGEAIVEVSDILGDAFVSATDFLADTSEAVHQMVGNVSQATQEAVETAIEITQEVAEEVAEEAETVVQNVQQQASQSYEQIYSQVSSTISSAQDTISSTSSYVSSQASSVSSTVSSTVSNITSTVSSFVSNAQETVSSYTQEVVDTLSEAASSASSYISSGWNKLTGFLSSSSSSSTPQYDYSAPSITNLHIESITTNSVSLCWDTDKKATTIVIYAETDDVTPSGGGQNRKMYVKRSGIEMVQEKHHTATITGLSPGKPYYFLICSYQLLGEGSYSANGGYQGATTDPQYAGPIEAVTLPTTALITGVVKDSQENPIVHASVFIDGKLKAYSSSEGRYAVEVQPGVHTIKIEKKDYISAQTTTPSLSSGDIANVDFSLASGKILISGVVKDKNSNGLGGVVISTSINNQGISYTTPDTGKFSILLPMPEGGVFNGSLRFHKEGFIDFVQNFNLSAGAKVENLNITLYHKPPQVMNVDVIDVEGGVYKKDIFYQTSEKTSSFIQFGESQEGYQYQTDVIDNANVFRVHLVGLHPGKNYIFRIVVKDERGEYVSVYNGSFHTLSENEVGSLKVCVYDPKTLSPLVGARVDVDSLHDFESVPTGNDGCALIQNLKAETCNVNITDYENTFPDYLEKEYGFRVQIQGGKLLTNIIYMPYNPENIGDLFSLSVVEKTANSIKIKVNSQWPLQYHLTVSMEEKNKILIDKDLGIKREGFTFNLKRLKPNRTYKFVVDGILRQDTSIIKQQQRTIYVSTPPSLPTLNFTVSPNPAAKDSKIHAKATFSFSNWDNSCVHIKMWLDKKILVDERKTPSAHSSLVIEKDFYASCGEHTLSVVLFDASNRTVHKEVKLNILGIKKPVVSVDESSLKDLVLGEKRNFIFTLKGEKILVEELFFYVDWKDGNVVRDKLIKYVEEGTKSGTPFTGERKKEIKFILPHVYKNFGRFSPEIKVCNNELNICSDSCVFNINVLPPPPKMEISPRVKGAHVDFKLNAYSPYFEVGRWRLDFGDGNILEGEGELRNKIITHVYSLHDERNPLKIKEEKSYLAKLDVYAKGVEKGGHFQKSALVVVRKEVSSKNLRLEKYTKDSSLFKNRHSKESQLGKEFLNAPSETKAHLSLKIETEKSGIVNERQRILLNIYSDRRISGKLEVKTKGFSSSKEITLKEGRNNFVFWWKPEEEGEYELKAMFLSKEGTEVEDSMIIAIKEKPSRHYREKEDKKTHKEEREKHDVGIEKLDVPCNAIVGKKARIHVYLRNYSSCEEKVYVVLKTSCYKDKKIVIIRPKRCEKIRFEFIPEKEGKEKVNVEIKLDNDKNLRNNSAFSYMRVLPPLPNFKIEKIEIRTKKEEGELIFVICKDTDKIFKTEFFVKIEGKHFAQKFKKGKEFKQKCERIVFPLKEIKPGKYLVEIKVKSREINKVILSERKAVFVK